MVEFSRKEDLRQAWETLGMTPEELRRLNTESRRHPAVRVTGRLGLVLAQVFAHPVISSAAPMRACASFLAPSTVTFRH